MSTFSIHGVVCGTMLLLASGNVANAQNQPGHATLRPVGETPRPTGDTRELICRGKPGIDLRIEQDPSPRQPDQVAMVLRYERPKDQWIPGSCGWNPNGFEGVPLEPGVVHFDVPRDGQTWAAPGARDTSVEAAAHYPDVTSVPRYMNDSSRYWVFFVNDASNESISHGRWPLGGAYTSIDSGGGGGSLREASPERAGAADPAAAAVDSARPAPGRDTLSSARTVPTETGAGGPRDARTSPKWLLQRGISKVRAAPGPRGVRLTFYAAGDPLFSVNHSVGVMISRTAPSWNAGAGLWNLGSDSDFATIRAVSGGGYMAEPSRKLKAGHRYYYLITIGGPRVSTRQRTGSFTAELAP